MRHSLRRSVQLLLLLSAIFGLQISVAQTKDSLDNLVFAVSNDWKPSHSESYKQFTFYGKDKSFCQLTIFKAQPSSGNRTTDFQTEWKELVEKNFSVFTLASPTVINNKSVSFQRLGAKAVGADGNKYYVQLNVFDCGSAVQSVIAVSGTQKQLQVYDSAWQKLIAGIKKNIATAPTVVTTQSTPPADKTIVGIWGKAASGPPQYDALGNLVNLVDNGYNKGKYNLKSDGTYTFQGESWGGYFNSEEFHLTDEIGNYTVKGNQLVISPIHGIFRTVKRDGSVKKSQKLSLEKRIYTWQKHYYSGINETSLILTTDKENMVDGGYSQSELFPNSFIYSPDKVLEFRFLPYKF